MTSTCASMPLPPAPAQLLLQQLEVNRHRVERVLHLVRDARGETSQRGHAPRQLQELRSLGAFRQRGLELIGDAGEHVAELLELVALEIERRAEVAAAQPDSPLRIT